jgi:transposase
MHAYSLDLRQRVAQACDDGSLTHAEIADLFQVSTAWIRRLLQRRRDTGSLKPRPHGGGCPPKLSAAQQQRLAALVAADADATLDELCRRLRVRVSISTISRALARLRLTRKKSPWPPASATGPTSSSSEPTGASAPRRSSRSGSFSSTRLQPMSP